MCKPINVFVCFLSLLLVTSSCNKKEFDDYFARPEGLADPIYKELQKKGNFTQILACIEKAGYKNILGTAGYWTFFAANDDAFKKFYAENNLQGIQDIDSARAVGIITYGLAPNAYRKDQLTTLQGPGTPNGAFRRRTANYTFTYKDPNREGVVFDNNRNGATYIANDNNNKYISYFIDQYMSANSLSATDYNFFYPATSYTGFNVLGAQVVNKDIPAENGIIHEVDAVTDPLPSIEQYVTKNPDYSEFKKLLDRIAVHTPNATLTKRYNALTGKPDQVYIRSYPLTIGFSPNNEGFLNQYQTDGQENGWTIAVPKNDALIAWEKELLVNFGTFEAAPPTLVTDLISSFMWPTTAWPTKLPQALNIQVQTPTFALTDVVDPRVLSNGFFYGTKVAHKANLFRTVYSKAYLDPKYSLMLRAFNQTDLKLASISSRDKWALFMLSNDQMKTLGYGFNPDRSQWSYTDPVSGAITYSSSQDNLFRILQTSLVKDPWGEFGDLNGEGIGEGYKGEYVRFKDGKVYASGNIAAGTAVTIDSIKTTSNGKVYYTNGSLSYAPATETLGLSIKKLAESSDGNVANKFSYFYQFLSNSNALWIPPTFDIFGAPVGSFYTAFIPTNDAIRQAVKDGLLPGNTTTGEPKVLGSAQTVIEQGQVAKFILYHLVVNNTVAVDGKKVGAFSTLFKNDEGVSKILNVYYPPTGGNNNPASMEVRDVTNSPATAATVNLAFSNNLANRALIHSINRVLNFNK